MPASPAPLPAEPARVRRHGTARPASGTTPSARRAALRAGWLGRTSVQLAHRLWRRRYHQNEPGPRSHRSCRRRRDRSPAAPYSGLSSTTVLLDSRDRDLVYALARAEFTWQIQAATTHCTVTGG